MSGEYAGEPVIVVGNGPVGQTTALLLARWGIPVTVLDGRDHREAVGSKSICQQRDVLDVWASVGAGEQITREGFTWTTVRTFYQQEELFHYRLPDDGHAHFPPFVNISQTRTEQILDEHMASRSLIDVRWGHTVEHLEQDAERVRVTGRTPSGEVRLTAPYVVCCTGARCDELRAGLGLTFHGTSFEDRFLICDIRTDLPGWEHERRFYFDPEWNPGRQVLIHPCPGSTFRIDWQVPSDYSIDEDEASGGLERRIRAIIGSRPYEIVWTSVYRFHSRLVDRMRVGRVLLAGDAAHLVAPFGARGLNSGAADAENAAWKIAFALRGWADEGLLASYDLERHAAAVENLEVTTATMDFLVPHDEEHQRRRLETLERAKVDPTAAAEVDSGRLSEPFWYVDSPLTTPDPSRPFDGRPARGKLPRPAPGTIIPDVPLVVDGVPTRLRALAREGLLVLAVGGSMRTPEIDLGSLPVRVLHLDPCDPSGAARAALGTRAGEVWVIRPDAHIAAILPDPTASVLRTASMRAVGATVAPAP